MTTRITSNSLISLETIISKCSLRDCGSVKDPFQTTVLFLLRTQEIQWHQPFWSFFKQIWLGPGNLGGKKAANPAKEACCWKNWGNMAIKAAGGSWGAGSGGKGSEVLGVDWVDFVSAGDEGTGEGGSCLMGFIFNGGGIWPPRSPIWDRRVEFSAVSWEIL